MTSLVERKINPEFFKVYELKCSFPSHSILTLSLWDKNLFKDALIGETKIDLSSRFFSKKWNAWGMKPIERRSLWNPASSNPQGLVKMWVEVMTPQEAAKNPPVDISPPKPEDYELRAIVWDMKKVASKDSNFLTGKNSDVFVSIQPEGLKPLKTDIHWRSTGDASFNWRMKWPIQLPTKLQNRVRIQVWDKDVVSPDDAIAEAILNLRGFFKKALRDKEPFSELDKQWVSLTHPNFEGVQGEIQLSVQLLNRDESLIKDAAVGNYKNEPNQFPVLPKPNRPESSFGWWRLDKYLCMGLKKVKGKIIICCVIILAIAILLIVLKIMGYL